MYDECGLTRIFHISAGSCHTLNGRAALPRRPESGRSSSFALPDYEMSGLILILILTLIPSSPLMEVHHV
jgi:hypothetical protein